jgi:Ni,Fe-hydrogenase III small subunit
MKWLTRFRKRSPWLLHYNAGSCNGCDIEILAALSPRYDLERFGVLNTGNPKQADIFLVTGPVTFHSRERLVELYAQIPEPKVVVAVGACTSTGGVFRGMANVENGIDRYIPVDIYVPGCAASPRLIIDGLLQALEIWERKSREIEPPLRLFGGLERVGGTLSRLTMAARIGEPTEEEHNANN